MTIERCTKCILPHSVSPVNEEGVCQLCSSHEGNPDWQKLEADFQEIARDLKAKGNKYDCMVALTGGKDSSFVLHYMKNVCQTNPLAYTWDNGLIRDTAWRNINNALERTDIDHEIVKYDPVLFQKLLRATFREYERTCFCPIFVYATSIPVAVKNKVPAIITGFSEGQRELDHTFTIPDKAGHLESIKQLYKVWYKIFEEAVYAQEDKETAAKIMNQIFGPLEECLETHTDPEDYPAIIPLANYVLWMERDKLERTLFDKIGWQPPTNTFVHSSCLIEPIKGYLEFKGGMSEIYHELSSIIRGGYMTREDAMHDIEKFNLRDEEPQVLDLFLDFLSLPKNEFRQIVKQGPKKRFLVDGVDNGKITGQEIRQTVAWCFGCKQQHVNYSPKKNEPAKETEDALA